MLFSSTTFLFLFLPITISLYYFIPSRFRNIFLLLVSIIFYAWGEPRYLSVMIMTITINYIGAICIHHFQEKAKLCLFLTILLDLMFLFYFKYFNFIISNINSFFKSDFEILNIVLPLGISFYTFQALSYSVDVYRKQVPPQYNFFKLALYICLFPQLIAGPIVKYHDVAEQINTRKETISQFAYGLKRFIIGLGKKVLIANTLGAVADKVFNQPITDFGTGIAWIGAISYAFQIYYDFSGYSDMAIGLGSIFGFKFLENFNYPYISKSITEFWRRWHISLSTWFRDYVYIPLGGNRSGNLRTYLNLFIVFVLCGFWHGAEWTFLAWGIWNGFFIVLERILKGKLVFKGSKILAHFYTILVFLFGWVIFRVDSIGYAFGYFKTMLGFSDLIEQPIYPIYIDNLEVFAMGIATLCSMPIFKNILHIKPTSIFYTAIIEFFLLLILFMSCTSIAASTYNPFIYFRF